SMLLFQEAALRVGKSWPFLSEEARVGNLLPGGQSGTRLQAHINTNVLPGLRQTIWLEALARNADLPLACAAALDGSELGRAFQWPVHDHPHLPHIHDTQPLGLRIQFAAHRHLGEGETVVASFPTKTGIAWPLLAVAHAAKERLKGQVNACRNVLQHLR